MPGRTRRKPLVASRAHISIFFISVEFVTGVAFGDKGFDFSVAELHYIFWDGGSNWIFNFYFFSIF
jgi:hypothetical protein